MSSIAFQFKTNEKRSAIISRFGDFGVISDTKFGGAVLIGNEVYFTPFNQGNLVILNLESMTFTTISNYDSYTYWMGIHHPPTNTIHFVSRNAPYFMYHDLNTNTKHIFGSYSGINRSVSAVLAPNNKIYLIPYNSAQSTIRVIDPSNDNEVTQFGSFSGDNKWWGGVVVGTKIICAPYVHANILIIETTNNTTSLIGNFGTGINKWMNPILAPNGKVYFTPNNETKVLVLDPSDNSTYTFGSFPSGTKWTFPVLANNGKIYALSSQTSFGMLVVDTNTDTTEIVDIYPITANETSLGAVIPDGRLIFPPGTGSSAVVITPDR